jgi:transcriptional regulator with XRE-family HTH domain
MHDIQRRLGARIRQLREKRGWSQEAFADACGLHRSYMGAVERGEKNLTIASLYTIAKTLNTTIGSLFRGIA